MVVPFDRCIARPAEGGEPPQLLSEHLLKVARAWAARGYKGPAGCLDNMERVRRQLLLLGGLMHDAGKAQSSWQDYIRSSGKAGRGTVFHSPAGAALFFYASEEMLTASVAQGLISERQRRSTELVVFRAGITLDIAGHHGEIRDVEESPPWESGFSLDQLLEMDLCGLFDFVASNQSFPGMTLTAQRARDYIANEASLEWHRLSLVILPRVRRELMRMPDRHLEAAKRCLRLRTSALISADRMDAAGVERSYLSPEMARMALQRVTEFLAAKACSAIEDGASRQLVSMRKSAQDYALSTYLSHCEEGIYRLNLPTGLGKTMASLQVALAACAHGYADRIVYVAPYISILSQATKEIREATGLEVLQHHHLSVLDHPDTGEGAYMLTMESWQAPVVTTTFNQLFLALFPRRSQQTLRLDALRNAFVIVDEPQIVNSGVWKLFLKMIESLVKKIGCQVLFLTATMPPVEGGLTENPFSLTSEDVHIESRYRVVVEPEPLDLPGLVDAAVHMLSEGKNAAVVMNTVGNASKAFRLLEKALSVSAAHGEAKLFHLSGAMTPLHKSHVIDTVKRILEPRRENGPIAGGRSSRMPLAVVSTQVLEAGVDLSFDAIFRELPVLPSVVQVAGRANRHGEKASQSQVRVFRFVDDNGKEPRVYVYRSPIWREETDAILEQTGGWSENEASGFLERFFTECYARAPGEAFLEWLMDCASGDGSYLRRVVPFEESNKPIDVFVPLDQWVTPSVLAIMQSFGCNTAEGLYHRYLEPGYVSSMSFVKRKQFFALMQHFAVPVGWEKARRIADTHGDSSLWRLIDVDYYDLNTGLADTGTSDVSYFSI